MKKKLRLVPVVAILLVLLMATVAIAVSNNLFGLFTNQYEDSDMKAQLEEAAQQAISSTEEPTSVGERSWVQIDSTFFDGKKLMIAYKLKDGAEVVEKWQPSEDELKAMDVEPEYQMPAFNQQTDVTKQFYADYQNHRPTGIHVAEIYRRDHAYTDDGIDLIWTDDAPFHDQLEGSIVQDGVHLEYIQYSDLPEVIARRDQLNVELRFSRSECWYWFDGEKLYSRWKLDETKGTVVKASAVKASK